MPRRGDSDQSGRPREDRGEVITRYSIYLYERFGFMLIHLTLLQMRASLRSNAVLLPRSSDLQMLILSISLHCGVNHTRIPISQHIDECFSLHWQESGRMPQTSHRITEPLCKCILPVNPDIFQLSKVLEM